MLRLVILRSPRGVGQVVEVERDVLPADSRIEQAEAIEGCTGGALLGCQVERERFLVQRDRDRADAFVGCGVVLERKRATMAVGQEDRALLPRRQVFLRRAERGEVVPG